MDQQELFQQAKTVLVNNRVNGYTLPSRKLYPFQWNWDAGFIALGYASLWEENFFWQEVESLLQGQWENGFLPHILFHEEPKESYFPDASFWNSPLSPVSPRNLSTSGISQPPVLALMIKESLDCLHCWESSRTKLEELFPALEKLYLFYAQKRDRKEEGAISVYHPWESGLDNSPIWDRPLRQIGELQNLHHLRQDIHKVSDPAMRPTNEDYDAYLTLVEHLKKVNYEEDLVEKNYPFQVKDTLTTALFLAGAEALLEIADFLGRSTPLSKALLPFQRAAFFFEREKKEKSLGYFNYDVCHKKYLEVETPFPLLFLLSSHVDGNYLDRVEAFLWEQEREMKNCPYPNLHPSVYPWDSKFSPRCYWRGPIWININWCIYQGLRRHKMDRWAEKVRKQILLLVANSGCYEYFNPLTGQGLGADNFSWTAALVLDLLKNIDKES